MVPRLLTGIGIVFLLIGFAGIVAPTLAGTHLSPLHVLIHVLTGIMALYFGLAGTVRSATWFCMIAGGAYLGLGMAGFLVGGEQDFTLVRMDALAADRYAMRLIPGQLEFGTADHLLHMVAGAVLMGVGLSATVRPRGPWIQYESGPPRHHQRPLPH